MPPIWIGLTVAFVSALVTNTAYSLEHDAAARLPPLSPRRPFRSAQVLLRDRRWLLAFGAESAGWLMYVAALRLAPLSLVQAVAASGVAVLAFATARGHPSRLARREQLAVVLAIAGLVLLALSLVDTAESDQHPAVIGTIIWLAACGGGAVLLIAIPTSFGRAASLGLAAGLLFADGDISAKLIGYGGWWLLALVTLIVAYAVGTSVLQWAYQRGDALTAAGTATMVTNAVPIAAGFVLFGENLPHGGRAVLQIAAFACLVVGAVLLGRQQAPQSDSPPPRADSAGEGSASASERNALPAIGRIDAGCTWGRSAGCAAAGADRVGDAVQHPGHALVQTGVSQMESFEGKLGVVTGGGSGMGRELVRQLAAQGCSVAACDWHPDAVAETAALALADAGSGVLVTSHACDVSDEAQVLRFRDELLGQHARDHVDLVFANAGIGGGASFVKESREDWERTFAVDFWGVYYCARAFLPLLIASGDGVLVNTSSVNGLWAALGPGMPNNAYSAAKFAVRGFTEALIEDLRTNAPQVRVAVVMPGHVGTDIIGNTLRAHGKDPEQMTEAQLKEMFPADARAGLAGAGLLAEDASAEELRQMLIRISNDFRDKAPLSAARAATIILDGVRSGTWRILVGQDATMIDERIRANPEAAYDYAELFRGMSP